MGSTSTSSAVSPFAPVFVPFLSLGEFVCSVLWQHVRLNEHLLSLSRACELLKSNAMFYSNLYSWSLAQCPRCSTNILRIKCTTISMFQSLMKTSAFRGDSQSTWGHFLFSTWQRVDTHHTLWQSQSVFFSTNCISSYWGIVNIYNDNFQVICTPRCIHRHGSFWVIEGEAFSVTFHGVR